MVAGSVSDESHERIAFSVDLVFEEELNLMLKVSDF